MKKCRFVTFCIFVLIFVVGFVPACFAIDAIDATEAINQAELSLNSAFIVLDEAYDAGANVGRLIDNFEVASAFLSDAYAAFTSGDYEVAAFFASECKQSVELLGIEASRLRADAEIARNEVLLFNAFYSGFLLVLLIILGFIGWRVIKKRYSEKVLEMKPELEEAL